MWQLKSSRRRQRESEDFEAENWRTIHQSCHLTLTSSPSPKTSENPQPLLLEVPVGKHVHNDLDPALTDTLFNNSSTRLRRHTNCFSYVVRLDPSSKIDQTDSTTSRRSGISLLRDMDISRRLRPPIETRICHLRVMASCQISLLIRTGFRS